MYATATIDRVSQDNLDLARVGPGTLMGAFMRQYWIPAGLSSELVADGDPLRIALLGEKLVAFRDGSGRVGVMDHRCPHRCASLFLGRNEEGGLRCLYHGWKFDVTGQCVDMPNVPPDQDFSGKIRARAYPVVESGGLFWVYMGTASAPPPPPGFEVLSAPPASIRIIAMLRRCNWLQALEGDIDSAHLGFLHAGSVMPDDVDPDHPIYPAIVDRVPRFIVKDAEWGTTVAAHRAAGDDRRNWRISNFLFPFYTQTPNTSVRRFALCNAWVPMDDEHTLMIKITAGEEDAAHVFAPQLRAGGGVMPGAEPEAERYRTIGTGWFDRFRAPDDESNDWGMDRDAQRRGVSFSGISGINMQDQAINESMGPILDHSLEHLCPTDLMIARTRRTLLRAARDHAASGQASPGVADARTVWRARAGTFGAAEARPWEEALAEEIALAERWG